MTIDLTNTSLIINQSFNASNIFDLNRNIYCQTLLSSKEALLFQSMLLILLGIIIFYEILGRLTTHFNAKYNGIVPIFEPSVNKLFFFFLGFFLMQYYANYDLWHILFLGFGYFVVFNTELNKAVDFILWKVFKFKTKKQLRIEAEKNIKA